MDTKLNGKGANNFDSSTEYHQLNQNNQFHGDTLYNSNQPQFNQNLQNYPSQQIPQYQPLLPIYPQQSNNINSSSQEYNTSYQGADPNTPQNNYDVNGLNVQNPPETPQNEILTNGINNENALNEHNKSCQITMMVYLFGYSIIDMIYQIASDLVNYSIIDDFLLIILGVVILIFHLKGILASDDVLSFFTFIVWFAGTPLKFLGYSSVIHSVDILAFITSILRIFIVLCIAFATCTVCHRRREEITIKNKK